MTPCYAPVVIRARAGRYVPRPILVFVALAALGMAACAGIDTPTVQPASFGTQSPSGPATPAASQPGSIASPSASTVATPPPEATATPTGAAAACSQSDANRTFFAEAALSMPWAVYCGVLPAGWFVESGTYRLANGGELEVSYNGPGDARFALVEGNACDQFGSDVNACAPRDSVIGEAAFGDQTGQLGQLSNAFVLDVARGSNPMWRATGLGMSQDAFRTLCAALARVGGGTN